MKKVGSSFWKKRRGTKTIGTGLGPSMGKTDSDDDDKKQGMKRKESKFAMSMADLEGALAGEITSSHQLGEDGDFYVDVLNNSYLDHLGANWEVLMRCATDEQVELGEVSATNVNPPLRRKHVTRIRLPRVGMGGHLNTHWKLCIQAHGMSFEGGVAEVALEPGKSYKIVPIANKAPLDMFELFKVEDELLAILQSSKVSEIDWERVGVKVGRSANAVRTAYIEAKRSFPDPRHWLATQKPPALAPGVKKEELLHLIKTKQIGVEIYWRKFPGFDDNTEANVLRASTLKYLLRFGKQQGVTCTSYRNNVKDGSHQVAGPFQVQELNDALQGESRSIVKHLTKLAKLKPMMPQLERIVYCTQPNKGGWDSVEILVYANPYAMTHHNESLDPESVTRDDLRSSFGSGWPMVFRVHQYRAPGEAPAPSSSSTDKGDAAVSSTTQYFSMLAGVGTPPQFADGLSQAAKVVRSHGEENITIEDVNLGQLQPLYLDWSA